jgi:BirA family biotin operon repressor/biotin-[acetyl-CoA-carboxylase] ligase
MNTNDKLSIQKMLPFLSDKSISGKIHIYASLESTNDAAKELAASGAKHGTVVIADYQSAGKGRYGRSFYSPPGYGIYISFILRQTPEQLDGIPTLVTASAAVSVCEAIETTTGKAPQIKWVNDIFLDGKKICGILTEAVTDFENKSTQWIVVGIGVNFTTPEAGYPEEIKDTAGSLFNDSKPAITRNRLAAEIVNRILSFDNKYDNKTMLAEYRKRLMMLGQKVFVAGPGLSYEAVAIDISDDGHLIIEKENGETLSLASGEIRISRAD